MGRNPSHNPHFQHPQEPHQPLPQQPPFEAQLGANAEAAKLLQEPVLPLADDARVKANETVDTTKAKVEDLNLKAKATGEHLKEHAQFGERKAGDIVDETKAMTQAAEENLVQRAQDAEREGHHHHAEFESASAHALFHMREGLEMARTIAIDAKNMLVGESPAAGIETTSDEPTAAS